MNRTADRIKKNLRFSKRFAVMILVIYTMLVLYFMFFGFGRLQLNVPHQGYRFQLVPTGIPLWFPKHFNRLWLFSLGNLLIFTPFGILVPVIFNSRYPKFLLLFVISITILELLQMLTYLGSFDMNDIIINAIGATIGFLSYRMSSNAKSVPKKMLRILLLVAAFTIGMIAFAEIFNKLV